MRKTDFSIDQRKAISDFFVNIGSAWFIGGIVTNFFVKPDLNGGILSYGNTTYATGWS